MMQRTNCLQEHINSPLIPTTALYAFLFMSIFITGTVRGSASTTQEEHEEKATIDACEIITLRIAQNRHAADIIVNGDTKNIQLVDCHPPPSDDLSIRVQFSGTVKQKGIVRIDIRNVSLSFNSFTITPTGAASSFQTSWIRDLVITVENVVLVGTFDVLTIDTTQFGPQLTAVTNVSMTISNSILRSTNRGNVASIATAESGMVHVAAIQILGNTTVETSGFLAASITAWRVTNVTLLLDTSSCRGPTKVMSGDDLIAGASGALSLVRSFTQFASNVRIHVTSDGLKHDGHCPVGLNDITLVAKVRVGSAAVGGIALNAYATELQLYGEIEIGFHLSSQQEHFQQGDLQSSNNKTTVRPRHVFHANSTSTLTCSATAVGGIALNSCTKQREITSVLQLHPHCNLRIFLAMDGNLHSTNGGTETSLNVNPEVSIVSFADRGPAATATFGIAVNSNSQLTALSTIKANVNSSIVIAAFLNFTALQSGRRAAPGVTLSTIVDRGNSASSILGVVLSCHSSIHAGSQLRLKEDSQLEILVVGSGSSLAFKANTNHYSTSGIGGVIVGANQPGGGGSSAFVLESSATAAVHALLADNVVTDASVERTVNYNCIGVFSFVVYATRSTTFHTKSGALTLWVGAATSATIRVRGRPAVGVAVGTSTHYVLIFNPATTDCSFCSDGSVTPEVAAAKTIVVAASHPISGIPFSVSTSLVWPRTTTNNVSSSSPCSLRALVVVNATRRAVFLPPSSSNRLVSDRLGTPSLTHTTSQTAANRSATSSRTVSIPTPTPSSSVSLPVTPSPHHSHTATPSKHQHTATLSAATELTRTQTIPLETRSPNIVAETKPPKRNTVSVMLPGNEEAATVVVSSAGATNAVVSTLGSGGAGVVVVAGSAVKLLQCGLAEDDPKPAAFELPISFAVGDSPVKYYVGAVLAHTLLQCLLLALPTVVRRRTTPKSKLLTLLALMFCGTHPFFTATILGGVTTILFHNDGETFATAIAVLCGLVVITMHIIVSIAIHLAPRNGLITKTQHTELGGGSRQFKLQFDVRTATSSTSSSASRRSQDDDSGSTTSENSDSDDDTQHPSSRSSRSVQRRPILFSAHYTRDVFLTLFDGCRIFSSSSHRHYSTVEVTLASLVAMISGARPSVHCDSAAYSIAVLAVCGLGYVVGVRPFRTRLDLIFSVINNLLLVTLSASVVITLKSTDESNHGAERTMQLSLWLISVIAFVQLGVQGCWAYYVTQRRRHLLLANDDNPLEVPMLPPTLSPPTELVQSMSWDDSEGSTILDLTQAAKNTTNIALISHCSDDTSWSGIGSDEDDDGSSSCPSSEMVSSTSSIPSGHAPQENPLSS